MRWLLAVVVASAVLPAQGQAPSTDSDLRFLRDRNLPTDDAGLLQFFRERTLSPERAAALKDLLRDLASPKFNVRNRAARELVKAGLNARALLLDVVQNPASEVEMVRRAELCLRQINEGEESNIARAVARVLAERKPAEAVKALLDYVPFAGDPEILDGVQDALGKFVMRDGRPDPAALQALQDANANKRGLAAVALIRAGGLSQKPAVAPLLEDKSAKNRLALAIALVEAQDKDAVPILIERLADAPGDQLWRVTELLDRIAGEKAPTVYPSPKTPAAAVRDAWRKWWTASAAEVDLAKLTRGDGHLGYTLLASFGNQGKTSGKVMELRPDRSTHWVIGDLTYPMDARVIGPNRVLIAEYMGRRVTERDFQGKILWERSVDLPIACRRLPDRTTFIATRRQLLLVDMDNKELLALSPAGNVSAADRARDGHMAVIGSTGQCQWLDPQGREVKSFPVGYVYPIGGNLEILPNRHLLVPLYRDNKIAEFDADGKVVWQVVVNAPVSVTKAANGHVFVTTMGTNVVEIDREGKLVETFTTEGRAWRARGR